MSGELARHVVLRLRSDGLLGSQSLATDRLAKQGCCVLKELDHHLFVAGLPGIALAVQARWTGIRAALWPKQLQNATRLAVLSSRLGSHPEANPLWFDALRTVCCRADGHSNVLLRSSGTTANKYLHRAETLFRVPVVAVEPSAATPAELMASQSPDHLTLQLSVPIVAPAESAPGADLPLADRLLALLAHRIHALRVRRGGSIDRVLLQRLTDTHFPPGSVHLLQSDKASDLEHLYAAGAIPWMFLQEPEPPATAAEVSRVPGVPGRPPFDDYLLHWTRAATGPWPNETEHDFLDGLLLGSASERGRRTAFTTLERIVTQRRLVSSGHLIRGGHAVVCFSQLPLAALAKRPVYRKHLRRWDFEPYGLGIRRAYLEHAGARPAVYGDSEQYESLSPQQQPFFQRRSTSDATRDWSTEREWRHVGDVDLGNAGPEDVFVFVRTADEAARIGRCTDWQVLVVPSAAADVRRHD